MFLNDTQLTYNYSLSTTNQLNLLIMNVEKPNNEYFITYSNYLIFENQTLAFRKKELFNITNVPKLIDFNNNANCWLINRKQLTVKKAKELLINEPVKIDVSCLQWYDQINLNNVFNLK